MKTYIIDDDQLSIFLTKTLLVLEGEVQQISTFLSGSEALEALHACDEDDIPKVIFLDLNMPVMDGWNFLDALAPLNQRLSKKCSIYILTSSLDVSDTERMKDYPFVSGLIHKPIKSDDISLIYSHYPLLERGIR